MLLGGVLTDLLAWNWIFLVNLPVGITVFVLSLRLLPDDPPEAGDRRLDVGGAVTVTAAVMLGTYAVINGNESGWTSGETVGLLAAATTLLAFFLVLESRVGSPLMPLGLFRLRNISVANVVGVLLAGSMFGWFFLSALYLQLVLGYNPLEVGLAYLPSTLIMAAGSIALSDRLVMRFGVKPPIVGGSRVLPSACFGSRGHPLTAASWSTCSPPCSSWGSGVGSPSTHYCSLRWATSRRPRAGWPRGSSTRRS